MERIRRVFRDASYNWKSEYRCACGKVFVAYDSNVSRGRTVSCGCSRFDTVTTHSMSRSPTYRIWMAMQQRCTNTRAANYKWYGAKGIQVEWETFEDFLTDMGEKPTDGYSIDRLDPLGNYCKENCRWITIEENSRRAALANGLGKRERSRWRER